MKINKHKYLVEAPPVNDIEKVTELSGDDLKKKILDELTKNGFSWAAKRLNRLDVKQFEYFARSLGKNAFNDEDNIFLNFLNSIYSGHSVDNFKTFTIIYNVLIDSEFNNDEFLK